MSDTSAYPAITLGRRRFLAACTVTAAAAAVPSLLNADTPRQPKSAWPGYRKATVIDMLSGGPASSASDEEFSPLTERAIADVRASGITACNITVSGVNSYSNDYALTIKTVAYWNQQIAEHSEALMLVRRAADIAVAKQSGRLGLIYGFQDATPFGEDASRLDDFHGLGVRIYQLTYNRRNLVGDGCLEPADAGLSKFGLTLIERLNARRGLIDLSHSGRRTATEAITASRQPVTISHTACAALVNRPRNKTDAELRLLADKGGVAGIYLMPFLRPEGQPMAEDLLRHIEHAIRVCGEDHVGIGTDGIISGIDITPEYEKMFDEFVAERIKLGIAAPGESAEVYNFLPDLNTADRFDTLAHLLSRRGHSDARIAKVLGGNFARLLAEVWG
jgi:membrane dipeptidase